MNVKTSRKNTVRVISRLIDFNGDLQDWKNAFYELWRLQMTWSFAHEITVQDGQHGVFVDILCKEVFVDNLISTMRVIGYRNIEDYISDTVLIDGLDIEADDVVVDY